MKEGVRKGEASAGYIKHIHAELPNDVYLKLYRLATFSGLSLKDMMGQIATEYVKANYTEKRIRELIDNA